MIPASTNARWTQLCRSVSPSADATALASDWLPQILANYAEPHRHYHTFAHIADCLRHFDDTRSLARSPRALEFALWFHDLVYNPRSPANEETSAALARQFLLQLGNDVTLAQAAYDLILATKTHTAEPATDAALMVDIDLAIFGQPPDAFDLYETQIRKEYAWVPEATFAKKRTELLRQFLTRPRLYNTDYFFERLEHPARTNLTRSLQKLEALS
jgi:predicted metal-dependent HD superfamily phosphohydrolase